MAIRQRGNTYTVYYRDPETGKQRTKSFKTLAEAEKENARVSYILKYERGQRVDEESVKERETSKKQARTQARTVEWAFVEYLRAKNFTPRAIKSQYSVFRQVLELCGTKTLDTVTPQLIEDIKNRLIATEKTRATTNGRLRILRTVLYFAMSQGWRESFQFPRIPSPQYKKFVPPSPTELALMFEHAAPHVQRVIVFGAYCGVRVGQSELFSLTWADVDLKKAVLRVHGCKKNVNHEYREVPLRKELLPLIEQWHKEDEAKGIKYLISYEGKPIKSIKGAWETMLTKAGIERKIRPYDLRHMFGTELVAAGVDVGTVAKLMGHSSPTMLLLHYQYVLDKQKAEAVEKLPPLTTIPGYCQ